MAQTTLGPSTEEIFSMLKARQNARSPLMQTMKEVRDVYNGDVIIPLPELAKNERPAVANMINVGLNQTAMRIASTTPNLFYPPLRDGVQKSMDLANARTLANQSWWQLNNMNLIMRKRSRLLIGYSHSPVILRPDMKWEAPKWEFRNPLDSFPPVNDDPSNITPDDCIFVYTRNRQWLKNNFPDVESKLKSRNHESNSDLIDMIEYHSAEVVVYMASTKDQFASFETNMYPGSAVVEIDRVPNRTGICMVVNPTTINLDRPMGQYDAQVGSYYMQAKITALEINAIEKNIYPTTFLLAHPNDVPRFLQGPFDGKSGKINVVSGGTIQTISPQPNQMTSQLLDRLERNQRVGSATPSEFGGESPTNVRTGKRGEAVIGATVDFVIQEAQEIFEISMQEENKRAVAIAKHYFGTKKKSFVISSKGFKGNVDYVANDIFETDNNIVSFPMAGADQNGLMVGMGQRVAMGEMSKETMMEIDPMIDNPAREKERVISESLQQSILDAIKAKSQTGELPLEDIGRIAELTLMGKTSLIEALKQAQSEAQARQASVAPAGSAPTMPGMSMPGQGSESATAPAGVPPLSQLFANLRGQSGGSIQAKQGMP